MLVGLLSSCAAIKDTHLDLFRSNLGDTKRLPLESREYKPVRRFPMYDIAREYRTGKTVYELAIRYGCHRTTISALLKRYGVSMRLQPPTERQLIEMLQLYGSGISLAGVGERLGFSATTVRTYLVKSGATMRGSHGRS